MIPFITELKDQSGEVKNTNSNSNLNSFKYSFLFLINIIEPFAPLILRICENAKVIEEFYSNFKIRCNQISEKEFKELDKKSVIRLFDLLKILNQKCDNKKQNDYAIKTYLEYIMKMIKSSVIKIRLDGLNLLKELCIKEKNRSQLYNSSNDSIEPSKIGKIIIEKGLIEFLFTQSSHVEILKKTEYLINLFSTYGLIKSDLINLIWNASQSNHEDVSKVSYDILQHITEHLDQPELEYLYTLIKSKNIKEYNENVLNFMKSFTINSIANYEKRKTKKYSSKDKEKEK